MSDAKNEGERFSLKRWSQRKLDAARAPSANTPANAPLTTVQADAAARAPADAASNAPVPAWSGQVASPQPLASDLDRSAAIVPASHPEPSTRAASALEEPLPPIDSLTFESDFRGFLQPKVDEAVKRAALKKLFNDPRFNVMDKLDVYIDDYSQPDPLPREWLRELTSAQNILNPQRTRVNEQGFAEDVPRESADAEAASAVSEETRPAIDSGSVSTSESDDMAGTESADTTVPVGRADAPHEARMDTTVPVSRADAPHEARMDTTVPVGRADASHEARMDTTLPVGRADSTRMPVVDRIIAVNPADSPRRPVANTTDAADPTADAGDPGRVPVPRKPA